MLTMRHFARRAGMLTLMAAFAMDLTASSASQSATQAPAAAIDVQSLGPQVGGTVPDFTLMDQRGQSRSLQTLLGPKGALLVFFRSADW